MAGDAIEGILSATAIQSLDELEALLGAENEAVAELRSLFALAEASGVAKYLEFDPSCIRGLAYYTGQPEVWCCKSVLPRGFEAICRCLSASRPDGVSDRPDDRMIVVWRHEAIQI